MSYAEQDQKCTSQCISVAFRSPQQSMVRVQNAAAETDIEESWAWRRHQLRLQITDLRREQRSFRVRLEEQSLARDQVQGELAETLAAIADNLKEQLLLARNETLDSTITTSLHYDSEEDDTCNATSDQIASKGVADLAAQRLGDERRSVGAKVGQQHEHQVFNDLSTRTNTSAGLTNTHASVSAPESRHQDDNLVAIHENPKESITSQAELGVSTMRLLKKLDVHDYVHGALRRSHMRSWLQSRKIEEDPS
jgi:hypothetical protein